MRVFKSLERGSPPPLSDLYLCLVRDCGLKGADAALLADSPALAGVFFSALQAAAGELASQQGSVVGGSSSSWEVGDGAAVALGALLTLQRPDAPAAAAAAAAPPPAPAVSGAGGGARTHSALPERFQHLGRAVCHWVLGELLGYVGEGEGVGGFLARTGASLPVALGKLVALIQGGEISGKAGKTILGILVERQQQQQQQQQAAADPRALAHELGLTLLSDYGAILTLAEAAAAAPGMASAVEKWRGGSERAMGALVARVLSDSGGKACPTLTTKALKQVLGPCGGSSAAAAAADAAAAASGAVGAAPDGAQGGKPGGRKEARRLAASERLEKKGGVGDPGAPK